MTRNFILMVALLGLLLIVSCNGSDNTTTPGVRGAGTINGTVTDVASGDRLAGAKVTITSMPFVNDTTGTGKMVYTVITGPDGTFSRNDIANGTVEVLATHDGYRTPDSQEWALSIGGQGTFIFKLAPGEDPVGPFQDSDEQNAWPPDHQPKTSK